MRIAIKHLPTAAAVFGMFVIAPALAINTPTAGAKTFSMQPEASYNGGFVSTDEAAKRGLACIQDAAGKMTCFDSSREMTSSAVARREQIKSDGAVAGISKKSRKKPRTSADCDVPSDAMAITQNVDFNYNNLGWIIAGYARQNWYNMSGQYANSASSVSAGNHSGYLADYYGGGTPRFRLEIRQCERYLSNQNWNDRAQSRYRN